jgi:acyl-CoA thioesterase FadM
MEHQSREQRTLHSKEQFLAKFFEAARVALMERPAKPAAHRVAGLMRAFALVTIEADYSRPFSCRYREGRQRD